MPRLAALTKRWQDLPPAAVQLARIASFIGIKITSADNRVSDPRQQAHQGGIPLVEGTLPDDPYIGFLDDSIGLGQGLNNKD